MTSEPSSPAMISHSLILPVPDPLFQFLLSGFFLIHAVFMNMILGGAPVMIVTELVRWYDPNPNVKRFAGVMAARLPAAFALAVILGIVPLIGMQVLYGQVFNEAVGLIGNVWFCVGAGLILGYAGMHANKWRREWLLQRPGCQLLIGCGSLLGVLGVAFVFVFMNVLMLNPDLWIGFKRAGWETGLTMPSVWPRFIHMVCAAVAGVGMVVAMYGVFLRSQWNTDWATHRAGEDEYGLWVTRSGVIWALTGTLPQIVVGPWLLLTLPDTVGHHLIAGDTFGSVAFFLALTGALFGLVLLNAGLMVPSSRGFTVGGVVSLVVTIVCMVIVRETVRYAWLTPYMDVARPPSEVPWVGIITGAIVSMIGAGLFWYHLCAAGKFSRVPIATDPSISHVR